MFLFDFFWSLWESLVHIMTFSRNPQNNKLSIHVKSNTGNSVDVDLDPQWDIGTLKEAIAPKIGLPADDMEIILAGKSLDDSTTIADCDLGEQSVLHAVKSHGQRQRRSRPLNQIMSDLVEENDALPASVSEIDENHDTVQPSPADSDGKPQKPQQAHFYVYCATCMTNNLGNPTLPLKPKEGKLRVRCSSCKSGAIQLDSDPASWSDVLERTRITGDCQEQGCSDGPVAWAEFYFKCAEHVPKSENESEAVPLYLIRANSRSTPCLACMDIMDTVIVFSCAHTICLDCFNDYITSKIRERKFVLDDDVGYSLLCPVGCEGSLITEIHHFRLLAPHLYNMYQQFATEDFVLKSGGVLCPHPNCGMGIYPDDDCDAVRCTCGYVFCKKCLQGNHIGDCDNAVDILTGLSPTYTIDPSRAAQSKWDEASHRSIRAGTKPCPKCRTATERAGGCMHMVCTRCNFEWCWVCQISWTRSCMGSHWFG
uniref:E3 ubiquitin-protein ligase parkin n=1 Tax=Lygus hesperus TaxID=30085 RepID=A0A146LNZ3_LYGHE